jgi:hypothetical protein
VIFDFSGPLPGRRTRQRIGALAGADDVVVERRQPRDVAEFGPGNLELRGLVTSGTSSTIIRSIIEPFC